MCTHSRNRIQRGLLIGKCLGFGRGGLVFGNFGVQQFATVHQFKERIDGRGFTAIQLVGCTVFILQRAFLTLEVGYGLDVAQQHVGQRAEVFTNKFGFDNKVTIVAVLNVVSGHVQVVLHEFTERTFEAHFENRRREIKQHSQRAFITGTNNRRAFDINKFNFHHRHVVRVHFNANITDTEALIGFAVWCAYDVSAVICGVSLRVYIKIQKVDFAGFVFTLYLIASVLTKHNFHAFLANGVHFHERGHCFIVGNSVLTANTYLLSNDFVGVREDDAVGGAGGGVL